MCRLRVAHGFLGIFAFAAACAGCSTHSSRLSPPPPIVGVSTEQLLATARLDESEIDLVGVRLLPDRTALIVYLVFRRFDEDTAYALHAMVSSYSRGAPTKLLSIVGPSHVDLVSVEHPDKGKKRYRLVNPARSPLLSVNEEGWLMPAYVRYTGDIWFGDELEITLHCDVMTPDISCATVTRRLKVSSIAVEYLPIQLVSGTFFWPN